MKNKTTNKGITLIALVITIIVMLILVAVTISMAIKGGLFGYAGKAAGDMQNEIDKEHALANGKIQVGDKVYNSIDEYVNEKKEVHNWTRYEDTFTCLHCNANYGIRQEVRYTATGTSKIYADRLGFEGVEVNEISVTSQETEWIVLGIEDTNNNGTNETLLITSAEPLKLIYPDGLESGLPLQGAAAYNNGPDEINRICKELYSNSEYGEARGMTIEDVNAALNYTPIGGMYYDGSKYQTVVGFDTKLNELPKEIWDAIRTNPDGTHSPNGAENEETLGNYPLNGYYYSRSEATQATLRGVNVIFDYSGDYRYWLASRGVSSDSIRRNLRPWRCKQQLSSNHV